MTLRETARNTSSPTLPSSGDGLKAVECPFDERCLWATAGLCRGVVVVIAGGSSVHRSRVLTWAELDEIAEVCWDAAAVFAFGQGVLALAACGYALGREIACSVRDAETVRTLGALPVSASVSRAGRLLTARGWHDLAETPELQRVVAHSARRGHPWLQRLRSPFTGPSPRASEVTFGRWVAEAARRFRRREDL